MRFNDVPVNRSVPTEANRGLTSYMIAKSVPPRRASLASLGMQAACSSVLRYLCTVS
jgi:hypothetical protein